MLFYSQILCFLLLELTLLALYPELSYQYSADRLSERIGNTCFSLSDDSGGISTQGKDHDEAIGLLKQFAGCETIIGNLVVMNIDDRSGDELNFLHSIRKITGYLVVSKSNLTALPFPNLEIISGQNLAHVDGVPKLGLFVSHVKAAKYAGLNKLRELSNGDVSFEVNDHGISAYAQSINWDDIVLNGESMVVFKQNTHLNLDEYPCHESCPYIGKCWGPTRESCQQLSMTICQDKCPGRCYYLGDIAEPFCCHKECAGGCTGTSNLQCLGCKNFNASGECVTQCPPPMKYDKKLFQNVPNENVLYSLGNECLKKCPDQYLTEEGNCVKKCSETKMVKEYSRECKPCPPEGCPKRCRGFSSSKDLRVVLGVCNDVKKGRKCSAKFKKVYQNCTIIDGNIDIDDSFPQKITSPEALEVLSTVEEVSGYVSIVTSNFFEDLNFLRNLKRIKGLYLRASLTCEGGATRKNCTRTVSLHAALTIQALSDTKIKQLRLNSLERIDAGIVIIMAEGSPLCYLPEKQSLVDMMGKADLNPVKDVLIRYNQTYCNIQKLGCHSECKGGCWGLGPANCVKCHELSFEGQCVTSCSAPDLNGLGLYETQDKVCKKCDPQCDPLYSCTGPGPDNCGQCKNFKDGPYCVPACPKIKFANDSRICVECDEKCVEERGCTGANSFIGEGGCNFCPVVHLMEETYNKSSVKRIGQCEAKCAIDQYADGLRPYDNLPTHDNLASEDRVKVCTPCNELCTSCLSSGTNKYECTCKYAIDGTICVRECPDGKYRSLVDKTCQPCNSIGDCPKNCPGSDTIPLNKTAMAGFVNCDLVEGSVIINYASWGGEDPIRAADLESLNEIIKITGRLIIRDSPDANFTNLDMLRDLTTVQGLSDGRSRRAADTEYTVEIENNTALQTAELMSLTDIGGAMRLAGDNLCYVDTIDWTGRYGDKIVDVSVTNEECAEKQCHAECSDEGCLGPESNMCVSCKNKEFNKMCYSSCDMFKGSYDDGTKVCKPCHENCITCTGGGNHHCLKCRFVKDGPACVRSCSRADQYINNMECTDCNKACKDGCTGAGAHKGTGGCNMCKKHDLTKPLNDTVEASCTHTCPPKSFESWKDSGGDTPAIKVCNPCAPECSECTGKANYGCKRCLHVKQGFTCQEKCDTEYYPNDKNICIKCNSYCETCEGGGPENCTKCKSFELPNPDIASTTKICAETCPEDYPYLKSGFDGDICAETCDKEAGIDRDKDYCRAIPGRTTAEEPANKDTVAVALTVGVAIVVFFILVSFVCWKRAKQNQKKKINLLKHAQRIHDSTPNPIYEPVMQDDVQYPNDGELLVVTEDSLEIGDVLGSGAFGKVYEGRWNPGENHKGIRVAIKILKESGDPESTREFFDEAVVMGKLDHKHLVRILCLCAGKMMLVTQLMPLGSLLDYVRKNKGGLTSHHLLTYGYQIAKGMAYLEQNNVVHRDLAARNVLVQTPTFVKITDFGLAKMLSHRENTYTSEGGKLPIKWLAIESLKYRQFTSRSDTWSYGVTMWEVLESGQLPWRTKPPTELIRALDMGERLSKPKICTLEVYGLLLRCWVVEPSARPNFEDLMDAMDDFLKEPNRYVHINNRASTEGSFLSPHASVTSEHRDSGIVDVDRNYENDDRAMAIQRALYDATSSLRPHENLHYDPALTTDQDDVFSEAPSTARNSVIDLNRHDYVQDYLVPDQYSVDEGNGTDNSSQDQGYVKMNGNEGQYADLEPAHPEYSNTDDLTDTGPGDITQSLLNHTTNSKPSKNKFLPNRTPSPLGRASRSGTAGPHCSPRAPGRVRDDGYSSLKEPLSETQPLTSDL